MAKLCEATIRKYIHAGRLRAWGRRGALRVSLGDVLPVFDRHAGSWPNLGNSPDWASRVSPSKPLPEVFSDTPRA